MLHPNSLQEDKLLTLVIEFLDTENVLCSSCSNMQIYIWLHNHNSVSISLLMVMIVSIQNLISRNHYHYLYVGPIFFFLASASFIFVLFVSFQLHWAFFSMLRLSSCCERAGLELVHRSLIAVVSAVVAQLGLQGMQASVVEAYGLGHRLSHCGTSFSCFAACGIFPD